MGAATFSTKTNAQGDAIHANPEIAARLKKVYALSRRDMNFELGTQSPYSVLLERLGNPHLKLPPVIHVAGTNGKGSTTAMFRSIFEAAGLKAHVYTSPHLVCFNERIVYASEQIDDAALLRYLKRVDEVNGDNPVTFFEYTTALAFTVFADIKADICLLEVGLGGRLDCTNIIPQNILSVITQIGYDHTEFLGDTLEAIAAEKAGIIKSQSKVVIAEQSYKQAQDFLQHFVAEKGNEFVVAHQPYPTHFPQPNLQGHYQQTNAKTVLAGLALIKKHFDFSETETIQGLTHVNWPARMQDISAYFNLKDGQNIWLDSGHNEAAAFCLADHVRSWKNTRSILLVGMQKSKDASLFVKPLVPFFDAIYAVDNLNANFPQTAADMAAFIKEKSDVDVREGGNVMDCLMRIIGEQNEPFQLMIAGSVYLAGEVLKNLSIKP
jgi:dihydrofolate synthase/folylpolyglutamate synthase